MDQYLRRLKQELLSMREFGDGLQEQMNCMMGALQELKLLQVQAALEQLEISGEQNHLQSMRANQCYQSVREASEVRHQSNKQAEKPLAGGRYPDNSSLADSSLNFVSVPGPKLGHQVFSARERQTEITCASSSLLPPVETCTTLEPQAPGAVLQSHHLSSITSSYFGKEQCMDESVHDDTNDWTSSLMSQSRNRQPLVLGDNIFADLVGNWLDLPEMEKKGEKNESLLNCSRSQELCKKFSLTANFFKKFLRSVRPDRDKLLKEKPGWLHIEDQASQISKRSKKASKQKSVFYFPSQTDIKVKADKPGKTSRKSIAMIKTYFKNDQRQDDTVYPGFDLNTVVWV
ncbi:PREDICTED: protein FAM212B [Nanorana parkeri]|uniref:protein FAM212B n=1 Tax=Nanorana parkeri TaxID=125878 RepID=UPI000854007E|nr:PREDICTED: protein FAM212B [Nanorana parkeri]